MTRSGVLYRTDRTLSLAQDSGLGTSVLMIVKSFVFMQKTFTNQFVSFVLQCS